MALSATIYKAEVQVSDLDRHYYQHHNLTLARHPSETDLRMMIRLLAFCCNASEALSFTKDMSDPDEPALWAKDLTGQIMLWIDLGQPDEKRILKACGRSAKVLVLSYQASSPLWWNQIKSKLTRLDNLQVLYLPKELGDQLASLAQRSMQIQFMVEENQIWFSRGEDSLQLQFERWL
jgi:uncharacterized protein YaeQ